jgi:hypothetical protein
LWCNSFVDSLFSFTAGGIPVIQSAPPAVFPSTAQRRS